jgi:hypothetical protein
VPASFTLRWLRSPSRIHWSYVPAAVFWSVLGWVEFGPIGLLACLAGGVALTFAVLWLNTGHPWPARSSRPAGPYARAGERAITPEDDAAWERRMTERLRAAGREHLGDQ